MEGLECKGSLHRVKKCAADILSMEDEVVDDECSWELIGRDFRLKSVFLFCDLNQIISCYSDEHKNTLTYLANKLLDYMDELDCAVKKRSFALIQIRYTEATMALQEVMDVLFPPSLD